MNIGDSIAATYSGYVVTTIENKVYKTKDGLRGMLHGSLEKTNEGYVFKDRFGDIIVNENEFDIEKPEQKKELKKKFYTLVSGIADDHTTTLHPTIESLISEIKESVSGEGDFYLIVEDYIRNVCGMDETEFSFSDKDLVEKFIKIISKDDDISFAYTGCFDGMNISFIDITTHEI